MSPIMNITYLHQAVMSYSAVMEGFLPGSEQQGHHSHLCTMKQDFTQMHVDKAISLRLGLPEH